MTILQEKGIYSGGSISFSSDSILISPFLLNLIGGGVSGSGGTPSNIAKIIKVEINSSLTPGPVINRVSLFAPTYTINVGNPEGSVWISFNESLMDINLSLSKPTNTIIFGKISWPAGAGKTISSLEIDLSERTESYLATSLNPESPSHLYRDGTRWVAGNKNIPLSNLLVAQEVMQGVDRLSMGGEYFLSFSQSAQIYGEGQYIVVGECSHVARTLDNKFISFHTKIDEIAYIDGSSTRPSLTPTVAKKKIEGVVDITNISTSVLGSSTKFTKLKVGDILEVVDTSESVQVASIIDDTHLTLTSIPTTPALGTSLIGRANAAMINIYSSPSLYRNQNIYVMINKTTGAPSIGFSESPSTHYTFARTLAPVSGSATDLDGVEFEVLNDLNGIDRVREEMGSLFKGTLASGFLTPPELSEGSGSNLISFGKNILHILGHSINLGDTNIDLGAPPSSGSELDFVFLEVWREETPNIQVFSSIRVVKGINPINKNNPFSDPLVNSTAIAPAAFLVQEREGHWSSIDINNGVDLKRFAIPIALVSRFNSALFSSGNLNGGVGRPDQKTALLINKDEILNLAPFSGRERTNLLNSSINLLLQGLLKTGFDQAVYDEGLTGSFSTNPYQIDYIGSYSPGSKIGESDGGKRVWSRNTFQEIKFSFKFKSDSEAPNVGLGYTSPFCTFNEVNKKLTISPSISNDFQLSIDQLTGQPLVEIRWVDNGELVELASPWNIDGNSGVADITLDFSNHPVVSEIAVVFKAKYVDASGFSKIPSSIKSVKRNDASGFSNYFAVASSLQTHISKERDLTRSSTINSINYVDFLCVDSFGSSIKGYAHSIGYHKSGNGTSGPYTIPISLESTYTACSVIKAENAITKAPYPISYTEISGSDLLVRLKNGVPNNTPIIFYVGVEGNQFDYDKGSLEISNLGKASTINTINGNPITVGSSAIIRYCSGRLIWGLSSQNGKCVVWVNNISVPVKVEGLGSNLLTLDLSLTSVEWSSLTSAQKALYSVGSGGLYRPNSAYLVQFSIFESIEENSSIVIKYSYSASPWNPFDPTKGKAEVVDRGFFLLTTDGPANKGSSAFSPVSERFPEVQGVSNVGDGGVEASPLGLSDIMNFQQVESLFLEGSEIKFDGSLGLSSFVQAPNGMAVWVCKIKQGSSHLLFAYCVRDGQFILNNPNQAFITELQYNVRDIK